MGLVCSQLHSENTYLSLSSGVSAEISVFVQTGDSVQLHIQTQLPEFELLSWINDKLKNIVRYNSASKIGTPHDSYKDRVDFNTETFSLTLKNMQKTDNGSYTARIVGSDYTDIVTYRVSVIGGCDFALCVQLIRLNYEDVFLCAVLYSTSGEINPMLQSCFTHR